MTGSELKAARIAAGLTQRELAAKLGIGRATVQRVEGGASNYTIADRWVAACGKGALVLVKDEDGVSYRWGSAYLGDDGDDCAIGCPCPDYDAFDRHGHRLPDSFPTAEAAADAIGARLPDQPEAAEVPALTPPKVGDRWGDLTREQRAMVPVGSVAGVAERPDHFKFAPDDWRLVTDPACAPTTDAQLFLHRRITRLGPAAEAAATVAPQPPPTPGEDWKARALAAEKERDEVRAKLAAAEKDRDEAWTSNEAYAEEVRGYYHERDEWKARAEAKPLEALRLRAAIADVLGIEGEVPADAELVRRLHALHADTDLVRVVVGIQTAALRKLVDEDTDDVYRTAVNTIADTVDAVCGVRS